MPWCHLFLMMPLFGLGVFLVLPIAAAVPVYLIISTISLFIYAKIVKALHAPVATGHEHMIGKQALVVSALKPAGLINYRGELWTAISKEPLRPGDPVRIVSVHRTQVHVENDSRPDAVTPQPHAGCASHGVHFGRRSTSQGLMAILRSGWHHACLEGGSDAGEGSKSGRATSPSG